MRPLPVVLSASLATLALACPPPVPPSPAATTEAEVPPATSASALASSAPAAASASAASAGPPAERPPWTAAIPANVPPSLADTFRKLASVGTVTVDGTGKDTQLVCENCGPEHIRITASTPALEGSYTAAGRTEAALVVGGSECGVRGRVWGCTVLLERRNDGGWRWKALAPIVLREPQKLRLTDGRELLVGRFQGSQMGGTWEQVFSLDFTKEEPTESVLVLANMDVCSTGVMHVGGGSIDALKQEDRNKDGVADLVISVNHGERPLPKGWLGCKEKPDGSQDPGVPPPRYARTTLVFLRGQGSFAPDEATKKRLANKRLIGWPELPQE